MFSVCSDDRPSSSERRCQCSPREEKRKEKKKKGKMKKMKQRFALLFGSRRCCFILHIPRACSQERTPRVLLLLLRASPPNVMRIFDAELHARPALGPYTTITTNITIYSARALYIFILFYFILLHIRSGCIAQQ